MGVRFYDKENMFTRDNYTTNTHTSCNCDTCKHQTVPSSTTTATSGTTTTQTINSFRNENNLNFQKSDISREIVGNSKEMKIESNSYHLQIVGNNNRIRISFNVGDITIIGNNTRLKIKTNHGHIKYTGNNGRISLGKDSTEQSVDYSGCNGVLKVQNSKKSSRANNDDNKIENNNVAMRHTSSKKPKEKYASHDGLPSEDNVFKCGMDYSNIFNRKKSLPNMATKSLFSENASSNQVHHQLPKSIINNFGDIVIANSSNICISPYSYTC